MLEKEFFTAGKAKFTLQSEKTGVRYTYRLIKVENEDRPPVYFIHLLTGSDNERSFTYLGMVDPSTGETRLTKRSQFSDDSLPVKAINWTLPRIWMGAPITGVSVYHEGCCGRCGRSLTVPESIESGIGPECRLRLMASV
jgi:hypothetical protein